MNIEIKDITIENKSFLKNLLELYRYDFSEFDGKDVDETGRYGYEYLDCYWSESGRYPLIVRVDDKVAGFVLIRSRVKDSNTIYYISEFFIMRKYRRNGIGRKVAFEVFDRYPGVWVVGQTVENIPAQKFWRTVISEYTGGSYEEFVSTDWDGPLQKFNSRGKNVPDSV